MTVVETKPVENELSGAVMIVLPEYHPIKPTDTVHDERGRPYRRTEVDCSLDPITEEGRIGTTFCLYGDVPPEVLAFLPGSRFTLQETGREAVPETQCLFVFRDDSRETREYRFRR